MQKKGIAVAGNMIVDVLYPILGHPKPGELTTIVEGISRSTGGALCNVIVDLAKLDPSLASFEDGKVFSSNLPLIVFDAYGFCARVRYGVRAAHRRESCQAARANRVRV